MNAETEAKRIPRKKVEPEAPKMAQTYICARDCAMTIDGHFYPLKANQRFDRDRDFWIIQKLLKNSAPIYAEGDTSIARCPRCVFTFPYSAESAETATSYVVDADFSLELHGQTLTFRLGQRLNSVTDQWLIDELKQQVCSLRQEGETKIARCPNAHCRHVFFPEKGEAATPTSVLVLRRG